MSRPPFDPDELERHEDADPAAEQLEAYARSVAGTPPADLADRIMSAISKEPAPRRSPDAWLAALLAGRAPGHRWARTGVAAASLVLVVGGVLAAGELVRVIGDRPGVGTSPSPAVVSASPSPSPRLTPSITPTPTPAPTVTPSEPDASTPEPSDSSGSTFGQSATPIPTETEHESDSHGGAETPQPTETPRASGGGGDG